MKILTLNTHAWMETDQLGKIERLASFITDQQFDVIALQEVNQSKEEKALSATALERFIYAEPETVVRQDNYAFVLLQKLGIPYYWTWIPVHTGFIKYDEGLAILTRTPATAAFSEYVSVTRDYENYRTRKIVGVKAEVGGEESWFVCGHFGWWNDEEELFRGQWDAAQAKLDTLKELPVFIMGDFNNVAEIRDEGYDYVVQQGWHDLYASASVKDDGATVTKAIKGWDDNKGKLRIDYIFSSRPLQAKSCLVVLNGIRGAVVSDHFGVAAEL
ncbi:maltose 6'-phosphate phosphatase [Paenibacillus forsythiae]|uniref:Maltose 6'-phosphate phosphatase n=1 Tax=Paenibacillus forsythiae TaxID=365616 RepID=A0ABU3H649_9BACL|nr:endonuclease/exonuclease/phosphatase family protein [Paenibacillus forsythiae]MDT3426298.1 maltose 6'-phosphate phosphatase [Paenibacillus forsythiae]